MQLNFNRLHDSDNYDKNYAGGNYGNYALQENYGEFIAENHISCISSAFITHFIYCLYLGYAD